MGKVRMILDVDWDPINDNGELAEIPGVDLWAEQLSEHMEAGVEIVQISSTILDKGEQEKVEADEYHNENCTEHGCQASSDAQAFFPCTQYKPESADSDVKAANEQGISLSSYG